MTVFSPRANRILIAVGIGILIAICISPLRKNAADSAIARGDFPAFYTLAVMAKEGSGESLYNLRLQQEVQGRYWDSLKTGVLPVAYPAFLALPILPLALLDPLMARVAWILINLLATITSIVVTCRTTPALRACVWQTGVVWLSFFPLLAGIIGGQAVGLNLILLATIIALSRSSSRKSAATLGILCGLWMFKPHYALAVVWLLLIQRRGLALVTWTLTCVALWVVGVTIAGFDWVQDWFLFAHSFSHIDLATNSDQMTGVVAFFYSLAKRALSPDALESELWAPLSLAIWTIVPAFLFIAHRAATRGTPTDRSLPYLLIAPILLLGAPAANFYDLSLLLIPLSGILSPERASDRHMMIAITVLGAASLLSREHGFYGGPFLVSTLVGVFVARSLLRRASSRGM